MYILKSKLFVNSSHCQNFLYRHYKDKKCYDEMRPVLNQPTRFFVTAKTQIQVTRGNKY